MNELAARRHVEASAFVEQHARCPRHGLGALIYFSYGAFVIANPDGSSFSRRTITCSGCGASYAYTEVSPATTSDQRRDEDGTGG